MNVLLLVVDTLRSDAVFGDTTETPTLDRIADRSWRFHRSFAASFPTVAHRTDVMTGRYGGPFHRWSPLDCDVPTLPGVLADAGYMTQLLHDTPHLVNGGHRFDYPFHAWSQVRGAEVDRPWFTDDRSFPDNWAWDPAFDDHDHALPRDRDAVLDDNALSRYVHANRGRADESDWNAAGLFRRAGQFLRDNADRENWFLWLDCFDPHEPWDAPPKYVRRYDDRRGGTLDPRSFHNAVRNDPDLPDAAVGRLDAAYRAKVTLVDRWLGDVVDALESTGRRDDTALVVVGDHGTNLDDAPDDRGRFGKDAPPHLREAHVPLLVDVPGDEGGDCRALCQPQDVFATVASLAGASTPDHDGHDLLAVAREDRDPRDLALTGAYAGTWEEYGRDDHLLFGTDGDHGVAFAAEPSASDVVSVPGGERVTDAAVRDRLHAAVRAELDRRGLDPGLAAWLDGEPFPEEYRATDSRPPPPGWRSYWQPAFR